MADRQSSRRPPARRATERGAGRSRPSIGAVRSPEAHRAIIEAAQTILEEKGYAGFTFDAVARLAGSSKPTLYRWWPNKAALIMEVYERTAETALAFDEDGGDLAAELEAMLNRLWSWWSETRAGEAFAGLLAEAQMSEAVQRELREAFLPRRRQVLKAIFERARARGEVAADADVDAAVALTIALGLMHLMSGTLQDRAVIPPCVRLVVDGLKTPARR
jgi:AcrR family transcriptional regulator